MLYELSLTIPKNTAETAKVSTAIRVWSGVIHEVFVMIPAGSAGLAHAQLMQGGHQFAPSTEGMSFHGDDTFIPYKEHLSLKPGWNNITLRGWNDDDTFGHKVTVWIAVLPEQVVLPTAIFADIRLSLRLLLRRLGIRV